MLSKYSRSKDRTRATRKNHYDDDEVDRHNTRPEGVKTNAQAITNFNEVLDYNNYYPERPAQKCSPQVFGKIAKWDEAIDGEMNSDIFMRSDSLSVISFLHNVRVTCHSNEIHDTADNDYSLTPWRIL